MEQPSRQLAVLDIGGTHVTASIVDVATWRLVGPPVRLPVDSALPAAEVIATFARAAGAIAAGPGSIWGVAMPDPFDYEKGIGLFEGVGKFEQLYGVDVRAALLVAIAPPPHDIAFINDADAFVLGEWLNGAATGSSRCAGITLGTGVGSGFVRDGSMVDSGPDVPPGGRAHRLTVDGAPLEDVMSRRAIRRAYAAASGDLTADVREICQRARGGDAVAVASIQIPLRTLGLTLAPWISRFGADVLVIGGSMAASWDVLEPPFLDGFASIAAPPRVAVAIDADRAPLLGAARRALDLTD